LIQVQFDYEKVVSNFGLYATGADFEQDRHTNMNMIRLLKLPKQPVALSALEWIEHREKMKKKYPMRWALIEIIDATDIFWRRLTKQLIIDPIWWVKYRTSHRYHILKLGKPGYYDADNRIERALSKLIIDFMEKENPFDIHDWRYDEEARSAKDKLEAAYAWFKVERKKMLKTINDLDMDNFEDTEFSKDVLGSIAFSEKYPNNPKVKTSQENIRLRIKIEGNVFEKDTEHMVNIIQIRNKLWT